MRQNKNKPHLHRLVSYTLCILFLLSSFLFGGCARSSVTIPLLLSDGENGISLALWNVESGTLSQPEALYQPNADRFPIYWDGGHKYIFQTLPDKQPGQVMSATAAKYFEPGTLLVGDLQLTDTGENYFYIGSTGNERTYSYPAFAAEYPLLSLASFEDYPVFLYVPTDGILRYASYEPELLDYAYHELPLPVTPDTLQLDRPYRVGNLLYLSCGNTLLRCDLADESVSVEPLEPYGISGTATLAGGYGDILILESASSYFAIQNGTLLGTFSISDQLTCESGISYPYSEVCFPWQSARFN